MQYFFPKICYVRYFVPGTTLTVSHYTTYYILQKISSCPIPCIPDHIFLPFLYARLFRLQFSALPDYAVSSPVSFGSIFSPSRAYEVRRTDRSDRSVLRASRFVPHALHVLPSGNHSRFALKVSLRTQIFQPLSYAPVLSAFQPFQSTPAFYPL